MGELLKKKSVKLALLAVALLLAVVIGAMKIQSARRWAEYNGYIESAEKYLTELEYEQAIVEYTQALEIEPSEKAALDGLENTYLAYAQSVADAGDYERAIGILEEGYELTGREGLREKMEELKSQYVEFPFELTDFRILGCDLFHENAYKFFETFHCRKVCDIYGLCDGHCDGLCDGHCDGFCEGFCEGFYDGFCDEFSNKKGKPYVSGEPYVSGHFFNNDSSTVQIRDGSPGEPYMMLDIRWYCTEQEMDITWAHLWMRAENVSELNYNILDYTDSPIIAGVSTYEDWCRVMQVDSIKKHGNAWFSEVGGHWRFQSTWGDTEYSEMNGDDGTLRCRLMFENDGFGYDFSIWVSSDGLISVFNVNRNLKE